MSIPAQNSAQTSEYQIVRNEFIARLSLKVRTAIYRLFFSEFGECKKILDVGVTSETSIAGVNLLESLYPHKERITAVGLEDAHHLEVLYPGLRFVQVKEAEPLPFADNSFDVTYSHAVIEHVPVAQRQAFLAELIRVSKSAFITTPNRFFPIETHTLIPLLHIFWPKAFYYVLSKSPARKFYGPENLQLLTKNELLELGRRIPGVEVELRELRFLGFSSNLILILRKRA